jgi:hypothetical protein
LSEELFRIRDVPSYDRGVALEEKYTTGANPADVDKIVEQLSQWGELSRETTRFRDGPSRESRYSRVV